ncbi:hypothetical protein LTR37_016956 [Vermiconidia calcicola]|uniref:Uncharacterized protein n=1 Tax=Vermiconidia calcicola TaxID=1690605 RepID=A0ACC3ML87_9PEZI|nr:hypothetical protein LTR37_016956 [Vermiconidia calcicola]
MQNKKDAAGGSDQEDPASDQDKPNDEVSKKRSSARINGPTQQATASSTSSGRARFVSDLNPEATLLNRPVPSLDKIPNDDIGVWVDQRDWNSLVKQKNDAVNGGTRAGAVGSGVRHKQRPHSAALGPLIDVYFRKVHPLLPLLDEDEFRRDYAAGTVPEPLVHALCLVAAKDAEAEPHLRLADSSATIPPRQFCSMFHGSVTGSLTVPVKLEKVTLIRTLALASLHNEGPEGTEEASLWLSQAMHYGQTLGIHLGQQASASAGNDLLMKRLFWCLWLLDRASAATNGRPIIMSDVDIAIEPFTTGESGYPAFEANLKIGHILNTVIDFYRPTRDLSNTGWEGEYPTFEVIIDEVGGWELSSSLLATIHLFYLTVGILSHRKRGVKELPSGYSSQIRQRLFAIEIIRLQNAPKSVTLHPLPVLPYSVSLALSVSYQHLRQSQMEHQQADARQDFRACVKILQNLRRTWSSADVMTTLAKKVLDELDRAHDLASFRIRRTERSGQKDDMDLLPPPTACHHGVGAAQTLPDEHGTTTADARNDAALGAAAVAYQTPMQDGVNLFDNMDDVFGTFMDPNYPLNLDDISFVDELTPFDWNAEISADT